MKYIFNRLSNTIGNAQTNAANKVTGGEYLGWKSWNIRLIVYGIMEIRPTSPERKLEFIPAASQDTPVFGINFKFSKLHFLCAVRAALRPCVRVRVCVCVCVYDFINTVNNIRELHSLLQIRCPEMARARKLLRIYVSDRSRPSLLIGYNVEHRGFACNTFGARDNRSD